MTMKKRHCRQLLNSRSWFPTLVCSSWSLGATQMMFCILSLRAFKSKGNGSNMSVTANPKFTLIRHISASDDVNLSCCSREFSQWEICFSWLFGVHFLTLMNATEQKHQWFFIHLTFNFSSFDYVTFLLQHFITWLKKWLHTTLISHSLKPIFL